MTKQFNGRREEPKKQQPTTVTAPDAGGTEDDKINAMFQNQGQQWEQTQERMATAQRIYTKPNSQQSKGVPGPRYICQNCHKPGHFRSDCPLGNDRRYKPTTGIPRSFLKTVEAPKDSDTGTFMVNGEGQVVVAVADENSWKNFQSKAKKSQQVAEKPDDPELEDPISHKLLVKPVKTPCCGTTFSEDTIQQVLSDSGVCPKCGKDVSLDQLVPDDKMIERLRAYKAAKEEKRLEDEVNGITYDSSSSASLPAATSTGLAPSTAEKRKHSVDGDAQDAENYATDEGESTKKQKVEATGTELAIATTTGDDKDSDAKDETNGEGSEKDVAGDDKPEGEGANQATNNFMNLPNMMMPGMPMMIPGLGPMPPMMPGMPFMGMMPPGMPNVMPPGMPPGMPPFMGNGNNMNFNNGQGYNNNNGYNNNGYNNYNNRGGPRNNRRRNYNRNRDSDFHVL